MINLKYSYIDEAYKLFDGYHHCIIGGLIVSPVHTIYYNLIIDEILNEKLIVNGEILGMEEMHLNDLFPKIPNNDMKYEALNSVVQKVVQWDIKIFTFHLKISTDDMNKILGRWTDEPKLFMYLQTFPRLYKKIKDHYAGEKIFIQPIIDAGFDKSFKKQIYPRYMLLNRGQKNSRIFESWRQKMPLEQIEIFDLAPLFADSQDERLIQIVDIVVGGKIWQAENKPAPFKRKLVEIIRQLDMKVLEHSETETINW